MFVVGIPPRNGGAEVGFVLRRLVPAQEGEAIALISWHRGATLLWVVLHLETLVAAFGTFRDGPASKGMVVVLDFVVSDNLMA